MVYDETRCIEFINGTVECSSESGFWYTQKGQIIKWSILGTLFALFMLWIVGGYIHAKRRLKAGKPVLAYHRFLVSWQDRKRYGQTTPPQNHFTFYSTPQNPYANRTPYAPGPDGTWAEPPPMYNHGADGPPMYGGASKTGNGQGQGMEMREYAGAVPEQQQQQQQSGVVRQGDLEQQASLPPRPPIKAKAVLKGFTDRFRK